MITKFEAEPENPQPPKKEKITKPQLESAPIKAWQDEDKQLKMVMDEEKLKKGHHPLKEVTSVGDSELAESIIKATHHALPSYLSEDSRFNVVVQSLNDFQPKDAVEAQLVAQATVAFQQGMALIYRGTNAELLCHLEPLTNLGIKMMRLHNETIEALNKYRRGGEQRFVIQHVNTTEQTIFNQFNGGVVGKENKGVSPCLESAEQKPEQMIIDHVVSSPLPMDAAVFTAGKAQAQKPQKG